MRPPPSLIIAGVQSFVLLYRLLLLDRGRLRLRGEEQGDEVVGEEHALILLLVMEPFSDDAATATAGPELVEPDTDELSKLGEAGASNETIGA